MSSNVQHNISQMQLKLLQMEGPHLAVPSNQQSNLFPQFQILTKIQKINWNSHKIIKYFGNCSNGLIQGYYFCLLKSIYEQSNSQLLSRLKKEIYNEKLNIKNLQNIPEQLKNHSNEQIKKLLVEFFYILCYTSESNKVQKYLNKYNIVNKILICYFRCLLVNKSIPNAHNYQAKLQFTSAIEAFSQILQIKMTIQIKYYQLLNRFWIFQELSNYFIAYAQNLIPVQIQIQDFDKSSQSFHESTNSHNNIAQTPKFNISTIKNRKNKVHKASLDIQFQRNEQNDQLFRKKQLKNGSPKIQIEKINEQDKTEIESLHNHTEDNWNTNSNFKKYIFANINNINTTQTNDKYHQQNSIHQEKVDIFQKLQQANHQKQTQPKSQQVPSYTKQIQSTKQHQQVQPQDSETQIPKQLDKDIKIQLRNDIKKQQQIIQTKIMDNITKFQQDQQIYKYKLKLDIKQIQKQKQILGQKETNSHNYIEYYHSQPTSPINIDSKKESINSQLNPRSIKEIYKDNLKNHVYRNSTDNYRKSADISFKPTSDNFSGNQNQLKSYSQSNYDLKNALISNMNNGPNLQHMNHIERSKKLKQIFKISINYVNKQPKVQRTSIKLPSNWTLSNNLSLKPSIKSQEKFSTQNTIQLNSTEINYQKNIHPIQSTSQLNSQFKRKIIMKTLPDQKIKKNISHLYSTPVSPRNYININLVNSAKNVQKSNRNTNNVHYKIVHQPKPFHF